MEGRCEVLPTSIPQRLHQDAANAANQEPPGKWKDLIERYRAKLAESKPE